MKKYLKFILLIIGSLFGIVAIVVICTIIYINISNSRIAKNSLKLAGLEVKKITVDEIPFRDLNKNGKLDPYEDNRNSMYV